MDELFSRAVFLVGDRTYRWDDVILAAKLRGDWDTFERKVLRGLACVTCAEEMNRAPSERDLEKAADEFRYERDLVAADEMEGWLADRALSVEMWLGYVRREWLRTHMAPELADIEARYPVAGTALSTALKVEGLCSGEFGRFAIRLAQRAAAAEAMRESSLEQPLVTEASRFDSLPCLLGDIPAVDLRERIDRLTRMEADFARFRASAPTPEATDAHIATHGWDWIQLDCRTVFFPTQDMAFEALLCAREDGESLEQISADTQCELSDRRFLLEDLDDPLRAALLASKCGELLGPLALDGRIAVLLVTHKVMPSPSDPVLRLRAEARIAEAAVDREKERRVRWIDSLP